MSLYKRQNVWWISIIHNGKRVRRSTETSNKKLAEKIHAKVLTQVTEGKWFDADLSFERTFEELAEKYETLELKEQKNWQNIKGYFNQLRKFFGPYKLSKINPALIDEFKQMRKAQGVKPATINRQLNILKRMLNLAQKRWMWTKEVPVIEMESKADSKRIRHLSFDEYHRLLLFCDQETKAIVIFAAWTGLRLSNILELKHNQVDLVSGQLFIADSETKNQENLIIPLSVPALKVLGNMPRINQNSYVFTNENGLPHIKRKIQRRVFKALKKAGIEDFRFHDLRHCFASWNRQAGVDIDTLADLMGHKDTRMTRRYAHITQSHLKKAISRLDESYDERVTI